MSLAVSKEFLNQYNAVMGSLDLVGDRNAITPEESAYKVLAEAAETPDNRFVTVTYNGITTPPMDLLDYVMDPDDTSADIELFVYGLPDDEERSAMDAAAAAMTKASSDQFTGFDALLATIAAIARAVRQNGYIQ